MSVARPALFSLRPHARHVDRAARTCTSRRARHYCVANDHYFDRGGIYGEQDGGDSGDNARRFAFLAAGPLVACAQRLVRTFHHSPTWDRMMREAMARDFGWARSEERHLALYRHVVRHAA